MDCGMIASFSGFDNATPGSGTVLNQCVMGYNGFQQLIEEQQEHSGAVTGSSANVQYGYASGTGSTNYIRPISVTYPNGRVISFIYAAGRDTNLNRVTTIQDPSAVLARYTYLGLSTVVRIAYPQPLVWLDLWGGASGVFAGLDLFNRIIDQRWQNNTASTPADIDRYQYGYDQDYNRLWKANLMTTGLDEFYAYDPLNRLTLMQRGTLNTGKTGITGTPVREMDWTLDITGNWPSYVTKTSGTTDLSQTRTSNKVNEITAVGGTPTWVTPAYDAAGNTTTMPQPGTPTSSYTAVYDAWNRMVKISAGGSTIATYAYDGRNRRIVKVTVSPAETRHFYFTDSWQDVEERVGTSTSMDKQYVWGVRYVDELVCRDDATPLRLYALQDANFNLTAICNTSGAVQERYRFDPYGNRIIMNASWAVIGASLFGWSLETHGLFSDAESGLVYNRFRLLHPLNGNFETRDSTGYIDGLNLYEYSGSRPTVVLDPFGLAGVIALPPQAAEALTVLLWFATLYGTYVTACHNNDCAAANRAAREVRDAMEGVLQIPHDIANRWYRAAQAAIAVAAAQCAKKMPGCYCKCFRRGEGPILVGRVASAADCKSICFLKHCTSASECK